MENQQETRATSGMPELKSLVNFVKRLRFKVVKLSTYNSLKNQSKLKDDIIVNMNEKIAKLFCESQNYKLELNSITIERNSLKTKYENQIDVIDKLQIHIKTQADKIKEINNEKNKLLDKHNELLNKYKRANQPRISGKFAKK